MCREFADISRAAASLVPCRASASIPLNTKTCADMASLGALAGPLLSPLCTREGDEAMKVVLFCGGLGMRIREAGENIPKPMVTHRLPADPVARDEVLRALRPQGLRPLPRLPRRRHQELLPELQRVRVERLRAVRGRQEAGADGQRHPRLEDHVRRHRRDVEHRPAAEGRREATCATSRSSWPTTATA